MANDYIDQWDLNTVVFDIHDKGRGQPNGVATLDSNGRVPYSQLPESAIELKGYWDASTNTPTLADGTGTSGDFYFVSVAGSQDLGSGTQYFAVGDRVLYDGSVWKNIASGTVRTINGSGPDAQGNIGGVVKSVNNVAPDANGNCTLTAMLSVNSINPDANGNINIGGILRPTRSVQYDWSEGDSHDSLSDADWTDLCDRASKCMFLATTVEMSTYDRSTSSYTIVTDRTPMIFLVTQINADRIRLVPISPCIFAAKPSSSSSPTTAYGWPDTRYDWVLYKKITTFTFGQESQFSGAAITWSNSLDSLFYRFRNMYIDFYSLNVYNS